MPEVVDGARGKGVSTPPGEGSLNGHAASSEGEDQLRSRPPGWDIPPSRPRLLTANLVLLSGLLIAIGAAAGFVISGTVSKTYAARFQVSVPTNATDDALVGRQVQNQVEVLGGRDLLIPVANTARVPIDTLVRRVQAVAVPGSSVITVTVRAPTRGAALAIAADISGRYVRGASTPSNQRTITYLQSQIAALTNQQTALLQQRSQGGLSVTAAASMDARSQSLATQITALESQLTTANAQNLSSPQVSVLTAAYNLPDAVSPKPAQAAALGALIGAIVAAAVIGIIAALRRPGGVHR